MDPMNTSQQNIAPLKPKRPSWNEALQQINTLLTPAKEIFVIIKPNPDLDSIASGLALTAALKKIGRLTHLICPTKIDSSSPAFAIKDESANTVLENIDQIDNFLPQNQLRLTIDYAEGSYTDGRIKKGSDGLGLTFLPELGKPSINPLKIDTRIHVCKPDAVICLEIENLAHLQQFYFLNQELFKKLPLINIDYHNHNSNYGKANIIDTEAKSMSEMIALILYDLRFNLDEEIGRMLYAGMMYKTKNFAKEFYSVNMLEALSICYKYIKPGK